MGYQRDQSPRNNALWARERQRYGELQRIASRLHLPKDTASHFAMD
jgi:hypothetical protein